MKDLMIIDPFCPEESKKERLEKIVTHSVGDYSYERLTTVEELENADLTNKRILFTLSLGQSGINLNWYSMMKYLRLNKDALDGSVGGVILDGNSEIFTKSTGRSLVFTANRGREDSCRKHHELQTRKEGASGSARAACQQPQHIEYDRPVGNDKEASSGMQLQRDITAKR